MRSPPQRTVTQRVWELHLEQPDHARERPVGVRGGRDDVVDIEASGCQKELPGQSCEHGAAAKLAPGHLVGGQQAESEPKKRDVRRR